MTVLPMTFYVRAQAQLAKQSMPMCQYVLGKVCQRVHHTHPCSPAMSHHDIQSKADIPLMCQHVLGKVCYSLPMQPCYVPYAVC